MQHPLVQQIAPGAIAFTRRRAYRILVIATVSVAHFLHIRMSLKYNFGPAVRRLRLARGLSQEELAIKAKINRVTMVDIETQAHDVKLETLERLAKALKIEPWELLREAGR